MLGFSLDFWDFVTFGVLFVAGLGFMAVIVLMMGLPGKIAIERKHPDAEAVRLMGYLGFMAVVPWIQAFIWAFKPTDIIDIRRFPKEEQRAIEANIAEMKGEPTPAPPADKDG
jgi:hypothetical protein